MKEREVIVIRGGGDLATGVIQAFYRSGFSVLVLECQKPTAIRRTVSLCEAVYTGEMTVEDICCQRVQSVADCEACWSEGKIPLLVDPLGEAIPLVKPVAVVDAILAKKNLGTCRSMAPITIALGPGFEAEVDVDVVIETMRGHDLGRLIYQGFALPNTGIPGEIGGKSAQRVLHAAAAGTVVHCHEIGDVIKAGEPILTVGGVTMTAPFDGLLRGLIRADLEVPKGMKIGDIDPRCDVEWHSISDKARALGNGAVVAYFDQKRRKHL